MFQLTEAQFLSSWYSLMQNVFLLTPPLYLLLVASGRAETGSSRGGRVLLPLLASFASLCLFTEAFNLARPVYVCFYPIRGETFRHPEETRLRIQWVLDVAAAALAGSAAAGNAVEEVAIGVCVTGVGAAFLGERRAGSDAREKGVNVNARVAAAQDGRVQSERALGWWWDFWKDGRTATVLMMGTWVLGMGAYWVMLGKSKEGKFDSFA